MNWQLGDDECKSLTGQKKEGTVRDITANSDTYKDRKSNKRTQRHRVTHVEPTAETAVPESEALELY